MSARPLRPARLGWQRQSGVPPASWGVSLGLTPLLALWTLPQTAAGLTLAGLLRLRGARLSLYRFGPFLFLVADRAPPTVYGISLGLVVLSDAPEILSHEFCHLYTGLWLGWSYLPVYGLEYLAFGHDGSPHERITCWLEKNNRYGWERVTGV